jgi:hypothetical protein
MRKLLVLAMMLTLVGNAMAFDLGNQAGDKPVINYPQNIPGDRQGGDTILDAVLITLPVTNMTGTTAGYNDDYDEVCPYTNSTSPDVVYTFVPDAAAGVNVDLFGSAYDTKLYMYDENLALVACNDDFYPDYTSLLENVPVVAGVQYFIVIDGYGGDFGDYLLNITEFTPCEIDCPVGAALEGEPPLANDYIDNWNGACNTDPVNPPFQPMGPGDFCGVTGMFLANGGNSRDTDWFTLEIGADGFIEFTGDAELATYMFELGPQDCNSAGVIQNVIIGPCLPGTMVVTGAPGSTVWFWVGPTTFASPDGSDVYEYDYVINVSGVVATEDHSWSGVKSLFN